MRFVRALWFRLLVGLAGGAVVGGVVYQASRLTGLALFLLAGAAAGLAGAAIVGLYTGNSVRLSDVKVKVPQLSEWHFVLTHDHRKIARDLAFQLGSRIATRRLAPGTGRLREALSSLHALTLLTRQAALDTPMLKHKVTAHSTVDALANAMISHELAPFLARWHEELSDWELPEPKRSERDWPLNAEFRADLVALQDRLREYMFAFGKLAGMDERERHLLLTPDAFAPVAPTQRPAGQETPAERQS